MLFWAGLLHASEIYHWVDENGVAHYSQEAPPGNVSDVERMLLPDSTPPDYDPDEDIYDVAGQAARMQAKRDDMAEKRKAWVEKQEKIAEQERNRPVIVNQYQGGSRWPYWGYRPIHPPARPQPPIAVPYRTSTLVRPNMR